MIKNITPSFSEVGKIKLGGLGDERTNAQGKKWRMPVKYDSFQLTKTFRNAKGDLTPDIELMKSIAKDQDQKLRAIPIVLHSDEIDDVFPTTYARYIGHRCNCAGDGVEATRYELKKDAKGNMQKTGESKPVKCPCDFLEDRSCKAHGILYCSVRVPGMAVAGAIHTFRTTSIISIQRIIGSLMQIKKAVGMLQGLPLTLAVQPVQLDTGTVYCAHIELHATDIVEAQKTALAAAQMRAGLLGEVAELNKNYRAMLKAPASPDEDEDEQAAVADEFHTPEAASEPVPAKPPEGRAKVGVKKPEQAPTQPPPGHEVVDGQLMNKTTGEITDAPPPEDEPPPPNDNEAGF
jgi:hypothetical protein